MIALSLIALTLITSHALFSWQVSLQKQDAYLINISGMQRMLSQRSALMAREIYHAESEVEADEYYAKLQAVTSRMESNHRELISGALSTGGRYKLSPELSSLYYGDLAVDQQVQDYVALCRDLMALYQSAGLEGVKQDDVHNKIVTIARNGFLDNLNTAVFQYEKEAKAKVDFVSVSAKVLLALGLCLLLLEAFLIFRPIVRRVSDNVDALEVSNAELTEFSYRISHDLRAPIVSSLGLVKVAKSSVEAEKTNIALSALDHIQTSMSRLEFLIDDIINLTKMKLTKVEAEAVDLGKVIKSAVETISHMDDFERLTVSVENDVSGRILTKRLYLEQSLQNLLSNAVKYYDKTVAEPSVTIQASLAGGDCVITVADNGIGFPEDFRDEIFGMFKRFHPKASFGSGLGLYLVAQNLNSLDGTAVYNPLSKGSQFTLRFPVTRVQDTS